MNFKVGEFYLVKSHYYNHTAIYKLVDDKYDAWKFVFIQAIEDSTGWVGYWTINKKNPHIMEHIIRALTKEDKAEFL